MAETQTMATLVVTDLLEHLECMLKQQGDTERAAKMHGARLGVLFLAGDTVPVGRLPGFILACDLTLETAERLAMTDQVDPLSPRLQRREDWAEAWAPFFRRINPGWDAFGFAKPWGLK